jgi:hypothetical protein
MEYSLIADNKIIIGKKAITLSKYTKIDTVISIGDFIYFNTVPSEVDLDWSKAETHQIWEKRCIDNPPELSCYNSDGQEVWRFKSNSVLGFREIVPESKKEENFITPEHYTKYIEKFKGKKLLEVYEGNWPYDFRYVLDANTGEIYDKMESR